MRVEIDLSAETKKAIIEIAKDQNRSMKSLIEFLCIQEVNQYKKKKS